MSWMLGIDDRFVGDSSFSDHIEDGNGIVEGDRLDAGNVSVLKNGGKVALKSLTSNFDAELDNLIQSNMDLAGELDLGHSDPYAEDLHDLVLDKRLKDGYERVGDGDDSDSSSNDDRIVGQFSHFPIMGREHSIVNSRQLKGG
ncbi:hypothetical protein QYF36_020332 [Acer negundo]|nr:hypothetical protein QYF36_020332 [Acer negundo]